MSGQLLNATATATATTASTSSTPDPVADICRRINNVEADVVHAAHVEARHVAPLATTDEQRRLAEAAIARLTGLGELDEWVSDVTVDEVLVNADNHIWIDRGGELLRVGTLSSQPLGNIIERILAPIGRRLDLTTPIVDARLADGSRVCAVIGPVGVNGASLSIRRFARSARQLAAFTDPIGVKILIQIVERRCNVVVSGATSSGKTSLLAALIATLPAHERIVVLEDTAELPIGAQHVVRLEARPPNAEGAGEITMRSLLRHALRLRPDRIVVGEVRGPEAPLPKPRRLILGRGWVFGQPPRRFDPQYEPGQPGGGRTPRPSVRVWGRRDETLRDRRGVRWPPAPTRCSVHLSGPPGAVPVPSRW